MPFNLFKRIILESANNDVQDLFFNLPSNEIMTHHFFHFINRNRANNNGYIVRKIYQEMITPTIGSDYIIHGLLTRLIDVLFTDFSILKLEPTIASKRHSIYRDVETYIHENYQTITIQHLVKVFHYNEDFYNRLIKEFTGLTYSKLVQNVRLQYAELLLKQTTKTIEDIAVHVGYQSKSYFYRIFHKKHGVSPMQYRLKASI